MPLPGFEPGCLDCWSSALTTRLRGLYGDRHDPWGIITVTGPASLGSVARGSVAPLDPVAHGYGSVALLGPIACGSVASLDSVAYGSVAYGSVAYGYGSVASLGPVACGSVASLGPVACGSVASLGPVARGSAA